MALVLAQASDAEAAAIVGALVGVASVGGTVSLSHADVKGIAGVWHTVFGIVRPIDGEVLAPGTPTEVAEAVPDPTMRLLCVRLAAVMAFVDGTVDDAKLAEVLRLADALGVDADFVHAVHSMLEGDVAWVAADEIRHNIATIPGMPWVPSDPYAGFLPYREGNDDPALCARYRSLADLPPGSFGRAFFDHYHDNGFAFPGDPAAVAEVWGTPHDSLHVLSGYSTSAQGEILVAAFTVGQLRRNSDPMESHILPTILIYHLGIDINKGLNAGDAERLAADPAWATTYAGTIHLGLDPAKLWIAWDRGSQMIEDVYSGEWDFWAHVETPLEALRAAYRVEPLRRADAALDDDEISAAEFARAGQAPPPTPGSST